MPTTDTFGNVYTIGTFRGTADMDPGVGVDTFSSTSSTQPTIYIQKLDAAGNFIWAKSIVDTGLNAATAITSDISGNIYITGYFSYTVDFDPGPGVHKLTSLGGTDIFVLKLDAAGNFVWAKNMGGGSLAEGLAIAVDASGNVYTTGAFYGSADFDPGPATYTLSATGDMDVFISKLDASGNFVWTKGVGGIWQDLGVGITLDKFGNVYTTGTFISTVDFDPGTPVYNLTASGMADAFVLKLNSAGSFVWARNIGGVGSEVRASAIAVDSSGNAYTTGYMAGTVDFDPGPGMATLTSAGLNDIYISKLNASGNYVWAKNVGGSFPDLGYDITLDVLGNVYTSGYFTGAVDFDPGLGTDSLISTNYAAFILKLDSFGNHIWAKGMSGALRRSSAYAFAVSVDKNMNVYTTGMFADTVDFDPDAGVTNLVSIGTMSYNAFVQKLNPCVTTSIITASDCSAYMLNGHTYTSSGIYKQSFANAAGCDSFLTLKLTINKINDTVTVSGSTLTTSVIGATYQWVTCPGYIAIPGATGKSYTAPVTGSYAVIVTQGSCTDTSDCHTVTGLGIDEQSATLPLQINPNPSHGMVSISTGIPMNDWSVQVLSLTGATVLEKAHLSGTGCTLDLGTLSSGVYFVKVLSGSQAFAVQKIVKE